MHRTRGMFMEDYLDDRGLDVALAARRAEASAAVPARSTGQSSEGTS
jgi:hypothetical protein